MAEKPDVQSGQEAENIKIILGTLGDTTWRMFVPSVGLTLLGVWLDKVFELKPWLMIGGILIGFSLAGLLVKRQIDRIKRRRVN
ncbi:hypothetical protein CR969_00720 [Candidatus Saccharibacteria bacterium]|nr:MAG: hypothetical protein CR969_00720 [Candidatus Saccharibacteria bacterium]